MGLAGLSPPTEDTRVVDDHAAPPRIHVVEGGACTAHGSVECDVENERPLIVGHLVEFGGSPETRVVHEHVDVPQFPHRGAEEVPHARFVGHVAGDAHHPEFGGGLGESAFVFVTDDDPRALLEATAGGGRTDAASGGRGRYALGGRPPI